MLAAAWLAAACERAPEPPPVLDAIFSGGRETRVLAELIAAESLAADQDFKVVEAGRDARSSHHLVWIRDREVPHRHEHHDLTVFILRGFGQLRLGQDERPVGPGSVLYVPRGAPHAFRNTSGEVAVAYAVYTPGFDGTDRVPVTQEGVP